MLIGVDPLLRGPLLAALDRMGHGDVLVICDANFPANRIGAGVIDLPGVDGPWAARAICSVFPVDVTHPVQLMQSSQSPLTDVQAELVAALADERVRVEILDRFAFYAAAAAAQVVVATGELRAFGNILIRKGTVLPFATSGPGAAR